MEIENKDERCLQRGRDVHNRSEIRFSSTTEKGEVSKTIAMPLRKIGSTRTNATSTTQESMNASDGADDDDEDELIETTRQDDDNDDDSECTDDDDTSSEGTSTVANSTICTSTLRFASCLENENVMPSFVRNNGSNRWSRQHRHPLHQPNLALLQEGDNDDEPLLIREGLTTDVVRAFMDDYYTDFNTCIDHYTQACWESFFDAKYDRERYIHMRPSGNPLDGNSCCDWISGGNLRLLRMTLVSLDGIKILAGGLVAIVVYTADQDFLFKGTLNRDRSINTAVIEEVNGECKIIQEHRSTGQSRLTQGRWSCE